MSRYWMALLAGAMGLVGLAGCEDERRPPPGPVVVEQAPPPPVVYYPEYYYVDGRYYHWYPHDRRWMEVREVPRGVRVERAGRLPERPDAVRERGEERWRYDGRPDGRYEGRPDGRYEGPRRDGDWRR